MVGTTTRNRLGPQVTVNGIGRDAVIETTIDEVGKITSVNIVDPGEGYDNNTTLTVRNCSIDSDSNVAGKWSTYNCNGTKIPIELFPKIQCKSKYWKYIDWYATGYNPSYRN